MCLLTYHFLFIDVTHKDSSHCQFINKDWYWLNSLNAIGQYRIKQFVLCTINLSMQSKKMSVSHWIFLVINCISYTTAKQPHVIFILADDLVSYILS